MTYDDSAGQSSYEERLKPWVVVLLLSKLRRVDVARFHSFSDAEGHAQILRQIDPEHRYIVVFVPPRPGE